MFELLVAFSPTLPATYAGKYNPPVLDSMIEYFLISRLIANWLSDMGWTENLLKAFARIGCSLNVWPRGLIAWPSGVIAWSTPEGGSSKATPCASWRTTPAVTAFAWKRVNFWRLSMLLRDTKIGKT